jgi:hypothetical protein
MIDYFENFYNQISFTPANLPSKKDVLRFLTFCILAYSDSSKVSDNLEVQFTLPNHIRKQLFKDLKASHYFTFQKLEEKQDGCSYRFKLPKRLQKIFLLPECCKLVIKKQTIRFMTSNLIAYLFHELNFTKLRYIDRFYKAKQFSDTSIKVLKQVSFEFIPLFPCYTKRIELDNHTVRLYLTKWVISKPFLIIKMLKRKFSHRFPLITYSLTNDILQIKSSTLHELQILEVLDVTSPTLFRRN